MVAATLAMFSYEDARLKSQDTLRLGGIRMIPMR